MNQKKLNWVTGVPGVVIVLVGCSFLNEGRADPGVASSSDSIAMSLAEVSSPETQCALSPLSRINVLAGGFVELDLGILELKAMPYVEFRFSRRK